MEQGTQIEQEQTRWGYDLELLSHKIRDLDLILGEPVGMDTQDFSRALGLWKAAG